MSVEREIWNIYTYATLHGNPREPSRLTSMALQKLCRETMLLDASMVENVITPAEIHLIFTSELNVSAKMDPSGNLKDKGERLDYGGFLSCLIRIADVCYPKAKDQDDAMLHLLMDNILPLANRRKPEDLQAIIFSPPIETMFLFFEDALVQVFDFYSAAFANRQGSKNMMRTIVGTNKSFEYMQQQADKKEEDNIDDTTQITGSGVAKLGTSIGYEEFMRFSVDFGLQSSLGLTALEVGDIYLSVISSHNFNTIVRHVNFDEFWETLVRCALKAFEDQTDCAHEVKVKCLFLYIWRHIQTNIRDQMNGENNAGNLGSYKGGLVRAAQVLNEKFISMWAKDDYKDYLESSVNANSQTEITEAKKMAAKMGTGKNKTQAKYVEEAPSVLLDIQDDDDLGDDRIQPVLLRQLLHQEPDLAKMLYTIAKQSGLSHE